ncbi:MAG: nuclear transport factor 2 family protein [Kofleriaceae bacterium]
MADHASIVRRCFAAYTNHDRAALEPLIAPEFRFTSPYDDAIDRTTYFERCWPGNERMRSVEVERAVPDGDDLYVTYTLVTKDGRKIHNTERMSFTGDQIASVEVFFGHERDADGRFRAMKKPDAR